MIKFYRAFLTVNLVVVLIAALAITVYGVNALLIALAHLSLVALTVLPGYFSREIKLIDPLNLFLLYALIGLSPVYALVGDPTLRILYISDYRPVDEFISGAVWYCVSCFLIGLGYVIVKRRVKVERYLPSDSRRIPPGFWFAMNIALIVSLAATFVFIQQTGGLGSSLAGLSNKRTLELVSDGEIVYGAAGYLRMASEFALVMSLVAVSYVIKTRSRINFIRHIFVGLLIAVALVVPFVSSSRSSIVFILFGFGIALYAHGKLTRMRAISVVITLLMLFSSMTALRALSQGDGSGDEFPNPFAALAESGNGYSLLGTTHILYGVPSLMDYKYGSTYLTWLTAPIPRSVWPDKPDVSLGKEIKEVILGQRVIRSGRPPSFMSEGWINFGPLGFLLSSLLLGMVIKLISNSFIPVLSTFSFAIPVYYSLALNVPALANSAFSQGVVRVLTDCMIVFLIYALIRLGSAFRPN